MDLLATVRKEGARGGRGDFKWSDVQSSTHRENYLGHSLMAPVGRWQKGRDLNWYAKGDGGTEDGEDPAAKAERERKEEIKRIKEAEQDELTKVLGFEVTPRNPNMETVGNRKEVDKILKEAAEEEDGGEGGKGVGFGAYGDQPKGILADRREAGGEAAVKNGVEGVEAGAGAGAGAKTEQKIQTEGGEGMSVANMMAEDAQDHTRGKDDVTQGPDHEVVKGSEMTTMLPRRKNTTEIEAARPVGVKSIDGAMINTIDKSGEDEASAELARE